MHAPAETRREGYGRAEAAFDRDVGDAASADGGSTPAIAVMLIATSTNKSLASSIVTPHAASLVVLAKETVIAVSRGCTQTSAAMAVMMANVFYRPEKLLHRALHF